MSASPRHILIADPDQAFLDSVAADPKAKLIPPLGCSSGKQAQLALADRARSFVAVVIDPAIEGPSVLPVVRFAHQLRPATPIYLFGRGAPSEAEPVPGFPLSKEDLQRLGIHGVLPKPLPYSAIAAAVAPAQVLFDPQTALDAAARGGQEAAGSELQAEDALFVPIRAADFLAGTRSFFDVFVRLASGRYVKVLKAGDAFTPDRIRSYLEKGVSHFYLRKEAQEQYLGYCDRIASNLLKRRDLGAEAKSRYVLNHGEETLNLLKGQGVGEAHLQYAQSFVRNVHELAHQLEPGKNEMLAGFLSDLAAYEHGVSTAMIASLLISPLKIASEKPVQTVGLAALLHDIGLYRMSSEVQEEDESRMTDQQKGVYRTHPTVGAMLLRGIHGIEPATVQAVAQHHERRNRKGFPPRSGAGTINRVAEIVGISDEFARLLRLKKEKPAFDLLREMEFEIFPGFTPPVVEAFRTVFFPAEASASKRGK